MAGDAQLVRHGFEQAIAALELERKRKSTTAETLYREVAAIDIRLRTLRGVLELPDAVLDSLAADIGGTQR